MENNIFEGVTENTDLWLKFTSAFTSFLPDIEHIYISEKIQIMLKKQMTFKKCENIGGGKCAKCCQQNPPNIKHSVEPRRQGTQTELQKPNPPTQWVRVE